MKKITKILLYSMLSIVISILLFSIGSTFSKFITKVSGDSYTNIAEPIFIMDKDNKIVFDDTKTTIKYQFSIKNFDTKKTSEVDLKYYIEILPENLDQSISFILHKNGQEVSMNKQKTDYFVMKNASNTTDNFELEVKYDRNATDTITDIEENIIINAYAIQN